MNQRDRSPFTPFFSVLFVQVGMGGIGIESGAMMHFDTESLCAEQFDSSSCELGHIVADSTCLTTAMAMPSHFQ